MFPRGSLPLSQDITSSSATCLASSPWEATLRYAGRIVLWWGCGVPTHCPKTPNTALNFCISSQLRISAMSTGPRCHATASRCHHFPQLTVVGCDVPQERCCTDTAAAKPQRVSITWCHPAGLCPCKDLSVPTGPTEAKRSTEGGGSPKDTVAFATLPSHIASPPPPPLPPPPPCAGCNEECAWLLSLEWEVKAKNTTSAPRRVGRGWWQSSTLDSSLRVRCKPHSQTTAKPHSQSPVSSGCSGLSTAVPCARGGGMRRL